MVFHQNDFWCAIPIDVSVQMSCHKDCKHMVFLRYVLCGDSAGASYLRVLYNIYGICMVFLQCGSSCEFSDHLSFEMLCHTDCTCMAFSQCGLSCVHRQLSFV